MTSKVQKWGNSLAVRIPRVLAEETRLCPGASVEIRVAGTFVRFKRLVYRRAAFRRFLLGYVNRHCLRTAFGVLKFRDFVRG